MKKNRAFRILAIVLVVGYLPQIPGCIVDQLPKSGRVVDKVTGKGVEHVAVIASTSFSACGGFAEYRCGTQKEYRVVTLTDADGNFQLPNQFGKLSPEHYLPNLLLLRSSTNHFLLTAFKPGYILSEDVGTTPETFPKSIARDRSGWWALYFFHVSELQLEPVQLVGQALDDYYAEVAGLGLSGFIADDRTLGVDVAIRAPGQSFSAKKMCDMPRETKLSTSEVRSAAMFFEQNSSQDANTHRAVPSPFRQKLSALDAAGFHPGSFISGDVEYVQDYSDFSAGHVCDAMNDIRNAK